MKKELREKVWFKYNKHCAYCGCEIELKDMQIDHVKPIYRDWDDERLLRQGLTKGIDEFDNYTPSCRQCNFYKDTFSIEELRERLSDIHQRILNIFVVKLGLKYGILEFKKPFDGVFYFEKYGIEKLEKEKQVRLKMLRKK